MKIGNLHHTDIYSKSTSCRKDIGVNTNADESEISAKRIE